jgi:hypothetical protein
MRDQNFVKSSVSNVSALQIGGWLESAEVGNSEGNRMLIIPQKPLKWKSWGLTQGGGETLGRLSSLVK